MQSIHDPASLDLSVILVRSHQTRVFVFKTDPIGPACVIFVGYQYSHQRIVNVIQIS